MWWNSAISWKMEAHPQKMSNYASEERGISTTNFSAPLISPCSHSGVYNLFAQETNMSPCLGSEVLMWSWLTKTRETDGFSGVCLFFVIRFSVFIIIIKSQNKLPALLPTFQFRFARVFFKLLSPNQCKKANDVPSLPKPFFLFL